MPIDYETFLAQDYAIINPLQIPANAYRDLQIMPLVPKDMARHEPLMPLLTPLKTLPEFDRLLLADKLNLWAETHRMPLFCALLQSAVAPAAMKIHWRRATILRRLNPSWRRFWLRLHDPRVFGHLRWILTPGQLWRLMGPIESWTWLDPWQTVWHEQCRPEPTEHPLSLELDDGQWAMLDEVEALNICLKDIHDEYADGRQPDARQLMNELLRARRAGLADAEDRALYAMQSYQYGTRAHATPLLANCLQRAVEREVSYVQACAEMTPADIHQAIQDMLLTDGAAP